MIFSRKLGNAVFWVALLYIMYVPSNISIRVLVLPTYCNLAWVFQNIPLLSYTIWILMLHFFPVTVDSNSSFFLLSLVCRHAKLFTQITFTLKKHTYMSAWRDDLSHFLLQDLRICALLYINLGFFGINCDRNPSVVKILQCFPMILSNCLC